MIDEAPDYAEPFQGWRVWRVQREDDGFRLQSMIQRVVWHPGRPLIAHCYRQRALILGRLRRRRPHPAPEEQCECGIYATGLGQLAPYLRQDPWISAVTLVLGRVSLWGTVIECERGWRASHAYPSSLYVPASGLHDRRVSPEEVAFALADYRVPVEVLWASPAEAPVLLAGHASPGAPGRARASDR